LHFDDNLYENYSELLSRRDWLPCRDKILRVDPFLFDLWLNSLVVERLQQKADYISGLLDQYKNNWEEAFYVGLARSFGFGLNAAPFELMARSVPLLHLSRNRNDPFRVEAILMGQAGFLEEANFLGYYEALRTEYLIEKKYDLKSIEKHL
jgi:hypothetical protein